MFKLSWGLGRRKAGGEGKNNIQAKGTARIKPYGRGKPVWLEQRPHKYCQGSAPFQRCPQGYCRGQGPGRNTAICSRKRGADRPCRPTEKHQLLVGRSPLWVISDKTRLGPTIPNFHGTIESWEAPKRPSKAKGMILAAQSNHLRHLEKYLCSDKRDQNIWAQGSTMGVL